MAERDVAKSKLLRQKTAEFCYTISKRKANRECRRKPDFRVPTEMINMNLDFGKYYEAPEPGRSERAHAWATAIGLQDVETR